jgi:hypothetical protein
MTCLCSAVEMYLDVSEAYLRESNNKASTHTDTDIDTDTHAHVISRFECHSHKRVRAVRLAEQRLERGCLGQQRHRLCVDHAHRVLQRAIVRSALLAGVVTHEWYARQSDKVAQHSGNKDSQNFTRTSKSRSVHFSSLGMRSRNAPMTRSMASRTGKCSAQECEPHLPTL